MSEPHFSVIADSSPSLPWRAYLYEGIYTGVANLLCTDAFLQTLQADNSFVFDFLPFPSIEAVYKKPPLLTIPKDSPRIYLTLSNIQQQPMSSCSDTHTCTATVAVDSHLRHTVPYQLVSYLPGYFTGKGFLFQITPEVEIHSTVHTVSANTDFVEAEQKVKGTVSLNITSYISCH
jgi:hypothetical protein